MIQVRHAKRKDAHRRLAYGLKSVQDRLPRISIAAIQKTLETVIDTYGTDVDDNTAPASEAQAEQIKFICKYGEEHDFASLDLFDSPSLAALIEER